MRHRRLRSACFQLPLVLLATQLNHSNAATHEELQRAGFADRHFSNGSTPGSRTDRGRLYIALGPPDEIENHPHDRKDGTFPWQEWIYRLVPGVGKNVHVVFVSPRMDNEYNMVPPSVGDKRATRRFELIQSRIRGVVGGQCYVSEQRFSLG